MFYRRLVIYVLLWIDSGDVSVWGSSSLVWGILIVKRFYVGVPVKILPIQISSTTCIYVFWL